MQWIADRAARELVLRIASSLREGTLRARFPNGRVRTFGDASSEFAASIDIRDDALFRRVVLGGEIGFGEAYVDGLWESDDIVRLLALAIESRDSVQLDAPWLSIPARLRDLKLHRNNRNTPDRARDNIHAHYDLGNAFFSLFLDETMTYSCAYFTSPDESLADAQRNKYQRLCDQARLSDADHVLEIGCGWGGFAMYAAENYGCRVTSITISREQYEHARHRVEAKGLASLIDVRFCDYRDIEGTYDKIVSIEMFEAVGAEYFATFFEKCDAVLRPGGRMAMQVITVPDRSFPALRDGVNWVQKYIFPGGVLPSLAEIEKALHNTTIVVSGLDDIGAHYATTLRRWRERFLANTTAVRSLGFDDRFIRMWQYYLAVSEAGFLTRNTSDLQIVFDKPARHSMVALPHAGQVAATMREANTLVTSPSR